MSRVVVPGGAGFLGRALAVRLAARGDDVVVLARGDASVPGARVVAWDGRSLGAWVRELDGADAVVHLTGRRVDVRPTRRNVDELISSRVQPVRVVGEAVRRCARPPRAWVQVSSLAVFGDAGDEVLDETATPTGIGPREMVTVCLAWEAAFAQAAAPVDRRVLLRVGVAIGGEGDPASARLAQLVRLGLGGRFGSGRQWVSWIALDDALRALERAVHEPTMAGTYHVTSPNPVTNAEMMATYRRVCGRRFGVPTPAWLVRVGAPLLGASASLPLTGRRAVPARLLAEGFEFGEPSFEPAVRAAVERS